MSLNSPRHGANAFVLATAAGLLAGLAAVAPLEYLAAALAAIGLGVLLLRVDGRTELIVAAYWAAFCLFSTMLVQWVPPGIFILFYLAMFLGLLAGSMAGGLRLEPTVLWLYAGLLAVVFLSLIGSDLSLSTLLDRLILYPFGAMVLLQFRSDRGFRSVVATAIATSLAIAVWVVVRADQADFAYRADLEVNQNVVSFYVGVGFVLALAWLLSVEGRRVAGRWAMLGMTLALGVMVYSLLLLASRGTIIAIAVTLLVLGVRTAARRPRRLLLLLTVLALAGLGLLLPGGAGLLERFESESTLTGGGRTQIWSTVGAELMASGPAELLLGHGFDSSSALVSRSFGTLNSTHNAYLLIAYDFGLIGLLLFLALHLVPFVRAWRIGSVRGALGVGLVAFMLATSLFLSTPDNFLYWAALGTVLAMTATPWLAAAQRTGPAAGGRGG